MSDTMFYGVLRMPYEMAMADELSRFQFYGRAKEAADRVERLEAELAALRAPVSDQVVGESDASSVGIIRLYGGERRPFDAAAPVSDDEPDRRLPGVFTNAEDLFRAMGVSDDELPLPSHFGRFGLNGPDGHRIKGYSEDQMRQYARDYHAHMLRKISGEEKLFGWVQFIDGKQTQNFARDEQELATIKQVCRGIPGGAKVEYVPVYSKLAQARAAGENAPWLTTAHMICMDEGIEPGHINDRLGKLRDLLDERRAAGAERDGWQWVPKKPTAKMLEAAAKADDEGFEAGRSHGASGAEIYAAMLAADPSADDQGNSDGN